MKKYSPHTVTSSDGKDEYIESKILRILTEAEALSIRAMPRVSVCPIVALQRLNKNVLELLTITEKNSKDNRRKIKLPSGHAMPGEHPYAAAIREVRAETGYDIKEKDVVFAGAVETTSTKLGETHYKIFLTVKDYKLVGDPIQEGDDIIESADWRSILETESKIPKGQKIGMQPIIDSVSAFSKEHYYAVGNTKAAMPFVEGTFDMRKIEKRY